MVGQRGVEVLVREATLVLIGLARPIQADGGLVRHTGSHPLQLHIEVDQVVTLVGRGVVKRIGVGQSSRRGHLQAHRHLLRAILTHHNGRRGKGVVGRLNLHIVQTATHKEREVETLPLGVEHLDQLRALVTRGILRIIFELHARHLTTTGRKAQGHHLIFQGQLLSLLQLGRSQLGTQQLDLTVVGLLGRTYGLCIGRRLGGNRYEGLGCRRIGGHLGLRGTTHRILIGLVAGQLLLITLLIFSIEVGEADEDQRHRHQTKKCFLIHYVFLFFSSLFKSVIQFVTRPSGCR